MKPRLPTSIQRAFGASRRSFGVGERIEEDDVGVLQARGAAHRDEVGLAGTSADEGDANVGARRRDTRHAEASPRRRKRGSGSIRSPW